MSMTGIKCVHGILKSRMKSNMNPGMQLKSIGTVIQIQTHTAIPSGNPTIRVMKIGGTMKTIKIGMSHHIQILMAQMKCFGEEKVKARARKVFAKAFAPTRVKAKAENPKATVSLVITLLMNLRILKVTHGHQTMRLVIQNKASGIQMTLKSIKDDEKEKVVEKVVKEKASKENTETLDTVLTLHLPSKQKSFQQIQMLPKPLKAGKAKDQEKELVVARNVVPHGTSPPIVLC